MSASADDLVVAGVELGSRLLLGTGGLPRVALVGPVLEAARPGLVTVSVRRTSSVGDGSLLAALRSAGVRLLPNTAGGGGRGGGGAAPPRGGAWRRGGGPAPPPSPARRSAPTG